MNKIKLQVDFYADGFRSGIIEVPSEIEIYRDWPKRLYITKELVKHLPKDRIWKLSINPLTAWRDDVIVIIRARKINENY